MLVCSNKMNRHMEPSGETSHMHITIHPIVLKLDDENYNNSDHMPGRWERKRERREYNVESWKGQETVDDATSQKYQILFGESNLRCMLYLIWKSAIFHIEVTEKKKGDDSWQLYRLSDNQFYTDFMINWRLSFCSPSIWQSFFLCHLQPFTKREH